MSPRDELRQAMLEFAKQKGITLSGIPGEPPRLISEHDQLADEKNAASGPTLAPPKSQAVKRPA